MKTVLFTIALAVAARAVRVPLCSAICMTNGIAATGCSTSDTACICTSERFFPTVAECAESDCSGDKSVVDTADRFCANAGIHVEVKRWGGSESHGQGQGGHGPGGYGSHFGHGRWNGGPPAGPGGKGPGPQSWKETDAKGGSPATANDGPTDGSARGSTPGTSGNWADWSSGGLTDGSSGGSSGGVHDGSSGAPVNQAWSGGRGRPNWGGNGNPWQQSKGGGNPPNTPTSPDHYEPHPTGPWEPPVTVI
ncbi:hypothetical protein HRR83_000664 [Exophiala dermatitidis]|uniref:CFEM domain-containing protein n=1 Tax=Exophiala dermatitidis TaxID=5970 RepID=A0AAN6IYI5_EXODE|nr:hypothetical protein HRR74_000667 [Exophiala dermatitidis]KAJ4528546.1 hypothetical protein HRR73_001169 [Exophiala dermatitidis]KAJ4529917.1 hypothetical protein HRR76_009165 [Exophiala dermatitidis]KAJ4558678.1 hypothetical protein HRR77_000665 [Exophiala dermatitidis]KAJ4581291.1 hypothetical protein HRR79_000333 [Exophiala dermatitidis]